jgi:hypothetical protein
MPNAECRMPKLNVVKLYPVCGVLLLSDWWTWLAEAAAARRRPYLA